MPTPRKTATEQDRPAIEGDYLLSAVLPNPPNDSERRESTLEQFLTSAVVCIGSALLTLTAPRAAAAAFAVLAVVAGLLLCVLVAVDRDGPPATTLSGYVGPHQ